MRLYIMDWILGEEATTSTPTAAGTAAAGAFDEQISQIILSVLGSMLAHKMWTIFLQVRHLWLVHISPVECLHKAPTQQRPFILLLPSLDAIVEHN